MKIALRTDRILHGAKAGHVYREYLRRAILETERWVIERFKKMIWKLFRDKEK